MSREFMPISAGHSYEMEDDIRTLRTAGNYVLVIALPWEMLMPHEAQALSNHSQSLERLASRGGLSPCEAIAILENRRWHKMAEANAQLTLKLNFWLSANQKQHAAWLM